MNNPNPYTDFTDRLKLLISKHPDLITTTLSNLFTMRLIGDTHQHWRRSKKTLHY
jgi:hypothetical protein